MNETTRIIGYAAFVATAWVSASCGGTSDEELLWALADLQDQAVSRDCECFWREDGYGSVSECRQGELTPAPVQECLVEALRPLVALNRSYFSCRASASRGALACLQEAGCDEAAFEACLRMFDTCAEDPCAGLTGDRFERCRIEADRAVVAADACD